MAKKARSHPVREVSYRLEDIEEAAQHIRDAMKEAVRGSTDADETINGYFGDEFSIDLHAVLPEAGIQIIRKFLSSDQIASVKITTPVGSQVMGVAMAAHYLKHVVIPCAKKFEGNTPPSASDLEALVGLFKKHGFSINQLLGPEQQQKLTSQRGRWNFKKSLARHYGYLLRILPTRNSSHDLSKPTATNKVCQNVFEDILYKSWHPLIQKLLVASLKEAEPPLTLLQVIQGMEDPNELHTFLKSLEDMNSKDREAIITQFKKDIIRRPPSLSIEQLGMLKASRVNRTFDLISNDLFDTLVDHAHVDESTTLKDCKQLPKETKEKLLRVDEVFQRVDEIGYLDLYGDFERRSKHWGTIHDGETIIHDCEQNDESDIDGINKLMSRIHDHIRKINPPIDQAQRQQIEILRSWLSACVKTLHHHAISRTSKIPGGMGLPRKDDPKQLDPD